MRNAESQIQSTKCHGQMLNAKDKRLNAKRLTPNAESKIENTKYQGQMLNAECKAQNAERLRPEAEGKRPKAKRATLNAKCKYKSQMRTLSTGSSSLRRR
jgi:hypothetical protein